MSTSDRDFRVTTVERAAMLRDEIHPLPGLADGFPRVLIIGTTGAGKTTLVRQLLGTDPESERFPSTSTAKTTVADTELVLTRDAVEFSATVTFVPHDEVLAALQDCFLQAALGIIDDARESEILRRILEHPEQRFRFRYLLGNIRVGEQEFEEPPPGIDLQATKSLVLDTLAEIRQFVTAIEEEIRSAAEPGQNLSQDQFRERLEEEVERVLSEDEILEGQARLLIEEMQSRFDLISEGETEVDSDRWPTRWHWSTPDRGRFIEAINRFSSNYAPRFGQLLTPLVNGIRVTGPFQPTWMPDDACHLVLVDVEGLGHTPDSSSAVAGRLVELFEGADRILLVDNAQQPMQAASIAALRAVLTSGNLDKLVIAFTHLDLVVGDNLQTDEDRADHVLSSAGNVVVGLGQELQTRDEQRLRARIESSSVLLGGLNETIATDDPTIDSLLRLIYLLRPQGGTDGSSDTTYAPTYRRGDFESAVVDAAAAFLRRWRGILGREPNPRFPKEHWARIKALARRLAELNQSEYTHLRPIADLQMELREAIYRIIREPTQWSPSEPPVDARDEILDEFANGLSAELIRITRRRIWDDHYPEWGLAYREAGRGSTYVRAAILDKDVYTEAAPAEQGKNGLREEVIHAIDSVSANLGIRLD